jgi:hypothetical protein
MRPVSRLLILAAVASLPAVANSCAGGATEPARVATTLSVTPGAASLVSIGVTRQFTAVVKDQNGDTLLNAPVAWSSDNAAAVSVNSSSGLATAVANGAAQITATSGVANQSVSVTVTQVVASIAKVSGDLQTGTVAQAQAQPIIVTVKDANNNAVASHRVNFTVTQGGGTLSAAADTTDASGQAQATWTLGQAAGGSHAVTASASSGTSTPVAFTATAAAGAATQIAVQAGAGQTGTVAAALGSASVARVADQFNNPVTGVTVTFAVTGGGGSVNPTSAASGATGQAQTTWTMGQVAGAATMTASAVGLTGSPLTFNASATAGAAANVAVQAGNNQTATAGAQVTTPPAIVVKDQFNNVKAGAIVTFAVVSGGGSVTKPIDTTDAGGIASVTAWTLGAAGANTLTATVTGGGITGNPITFTATANPSTGPANVVAFVGDNQTGLVGFALNVRPAVRVTDAGNGPVPSVSVTFAVASGGGSVTTATLNTNANGVAQMGSWVLGASAGANTVTATATGAGIAGNPVTFTATGAAAAFNVTIQNVGPAFSASVQTAFNAAVAKWEQIIYRDIADIPNFSTSVGDCGTNSPAIGPLTVDDVLIFARIDSIDGPNGILGQAGPCFIRTTGRLTLLGQMTFDSADVAGLVAQGSLNNVILHEMGHVLGFGSLWTQAQFSCLQNASAAGNVQDTYFSCAKAVAMFDSIGGATYTGGNRVPVENCGPASPAGCGAGTVNSHWREPTFVDELMTGYLNGGVPNPLSRLTVASLEDLGYGVNYAGGDNYVRTFTLLAGASRQGLLALGDDLYRGPIYVVDRSGRTVGVIQPR